MFHPSLPVYAILLSTLCFSSCTSLMARRAIVNFAESLESQDLEQLKVATSSNFEAKALRQPEALTDLKLLRFPKGDVRVVEIEPVDETTKVATVEIGEEENAKVLEYQLTLDHESGRWVVDDVILSQDDTTGREIQRSVTDQMDLLLTSRELLKDWSSAPRTVKLQHCTEELHAALSTIPPNWFNKATVESVGKGRSVTFRPEARLNGDHAVVVVPHEDGSLFIEFRKELNRWKAQNLAIESKSGEETQVRSLLVLAKTLNNAAKFLTTFADQNVAELEPYASPDFYSQSLQNGDISSVELPVALMIGDDYEAKQFADRTELLLEANGTTYMLTVRMVDLVNEDGTPGASEPRVDEVTIFDAAGSEVKKVSAMLLSSSVVDLYVDALRTRNLPQIRSMSSNDFNERVWKTEAAKHFAIMPYPEIEEGKTEVLSTVFRGDITEITVAQGNTPMTFILRLGEGWMVVDDVQMPAHDRPVSLKSNLEMLLPIHAFASAVHRNDVDGVIRHSSSALDQIVWKQLNYIPEISRQMVRPLMSEVIRIAPGESWMVVHTSDGMVSSEIKLTREGDHYVVHDVSLINETSPTQQFVFMKNIRQMIAAGHLLPKGAQPEQIVPVNAIQQQQATQPVQTTGFEPLPAEIYR